MTRDDVLKLVVNHARYSGEDGEGNPVYTLSHNGKFYMSDDTYGLVQAIIEREEKDNKPTPLIDIFTDGGE